MRSGYGEFAKVRCHSLVLATFSEQLGNLLMRCPAVNEAANEVGNSDSYVLVLADTSAAEMVKFLDQVLLKRSIKVLQYLNLREPSIITFLIGKDIQPIQ